MDGKSPAQWFMDLDGKKSGPHTAEQIENLLLSGAILPRQGVTSPQFVGLKVTAAELVAALQLQKPSESTKTLQVPPQIKVNFQAPSRPAENSTSVGIAIPSNEPNPTDDLFLAVQSVRERNLQQKFAPIKQADWGTAARTQPRSNRQVGLMASLVAAIAILVWGIFKLTHLPKTMDLAAGHPDTAPTPNAQISIAGPNTVKTVGKDVSKNPAIRVSPIEERNRDAIQNLVKAHANDAPPPTEPPPPVEVEQTPPQTDEAGSPIVDGGDHSPPPPNAAGLQGLNGISGGERIQTEENNGNPTPAPASDGTAPPPAEPAPLPPDAIAQPARNPSDQNSGANPRPTE